MVKHLDLYRQLKYYLVAIHFEDGIETVVLQAQERFFVQLFSPQNGKLAITQGTGTIKNDDVVGKSRTASVESDSFGESDKITYERDLVVSSSIRLTGQKATNPVELDREILQGNSRQIFTPTADRLLEIIAPATEV